MKPNHAMVIEEQMKSLQRKYVIPFLMVFVGVLAVIVGAFVVGEITPLEMGYAFAVVCFTAIVVLTLLLSRSSSEVRIAKELGQDGIDSAARKKTLQTIRNYKIAISVMPGLFAYALWSTTNDPLLPRIIGAAINIAITGAFFVALRAQKAKLGE
jgi:hypothetical protein